MNMSFQNLNWLVQRSWERLHQIAQIALLLCIAIGLFYLLVICPKQAKLNELRLIPSEQITRETDPALLQARALQTFTKTFPNMSERANKVKMLMDIADVHDLILDDVSYTTQQRPNDVLNHYFVDFSIFTPYEDAHYFINDVLYQMPNVSINKLSMHRESTSENMIETKLQLALHFVNDQIMVGQSIGEQQ